MPYKSSMRGGRDSEHTQEEEYLLSEMGAPSEAESREPSIEWKERKRTWKGYIWDTWDLPKEERRLLFKVDAALLTLASVSQLLVCAVRADSQLGFFIKNIDQSNINSAVSTENHPAVALWPYSASGLAWTVTSRTEVGLTAVPVRHEGGPQHVRQRARHGRLDPHRRLYHRPNPRQHPHDQSRRSMGHSNRK